MKINKWLVETFGFSKTEMYGIWIVLALIILLAIAPRIYFRHQQRHLEISQTPEEKAALAAWAQEMNEQIHIKEKEKKKGWVNYKKTSFDERGSKNAFYNDSKKTRLTQTYEKKPAAFKPAATTQIHINDATPEILQSIRGIGPALSDRIVKYRDLIGGFHDTTQLYEVYGLPDEVIHKLSQVSIFSDSLAMININTDSLKLLIKHPYIDYRLAKMIVNYRRVHGDYQQPSDLLLLKNMSDSVYQKLYPYISTSSSD